MSISFDDHVSNAFDVDNHLCHPQKSTSFWATLFILAFELMQCWRHSSGHLNEAALLAAVSLGAVIWFTFFRLKLIQVSRTMTNNDGNLSNLRSLSSMTQIITGLAVFGCLMGATFLM